MNDRVMRAQRRRVHPLENVVPYVVYQALFLNNFSLLTMLVQLKLVTYDFDRFKDFKMMIDTARPAAAGGNVVDVMF